MSRLALVVVTITLLLLGGCERTFRDMYDQPRYKPLAPSPLWSDGRSSRPPVDGTVARSEGSFAGTTSGREGTIAPSPTPGPLDAIRDELRPRGAEGPFVASITLPPTSAAEPPQSANSAPSGGGEAARPRAWEDHASAALLARGRDRFDIFCSPCHSIAGDGDGMIARRGFPHPPSFHIDRLRNASDAHFYAVITNGYGVMHSYARRVPPADRLAIIAYIRALQLSQHAPAAMLDRDEVAKLDRDTSAPASPAAAPSAPGKPR